MLIKKKELKIDLSQCKKGDHIIDSINEIWVYSRVVKKAYCHHELNRKSDEAIGFFSDSGIKSGTNVKLIKILK